MTAHRILLVEDEHQQSKPLCQMLAHREYVVELAENGMDAIERARVVRPDLVIVDLLLVQRGDDLDGYDVIQAIRALPEVSGVAILVWSGHFLRPEDEIRALRLGADSYVRKDVEYGVLEARIEALIRCAQGSY